jgi:hypothetical protein
MDAPGAHAARAMRMPVPVIPLTALALGAALFLIIPLEGPRKTGSAPAITRSMSDYASHLWPGTSAADLEHGRSLLIDRCIDCHHRPGPEMAQASQWPDILGSMASRAKLSDSEQEQILHYLLAAKMMAN